MASAGSISFGCLPCVSFWVLQKMPPTTVPQVYKLNWFTCKPQSSHWSLVVGATNDLDKALNNLVVI